MIPYQKSFIGLTLLCRVYGSPLFRAVVPASMSTALLLFIELWWVKDQENDMLDHPYGIGVLISSVSFLIIFRANYGYQRYWSACGDAHIMMSKFLDAAVHVGVYHMQNSHYDCIKPPNYHDNHDLNKLRLTRDREREDQFFVGSLNDQKNFRQRRLKVKSIESTRENDENCTLPGSDDSAKNYAIHETGGLVDNTHHLISRGRLDGGWGSLFGGTSSTFHKNGSNEWSRADDKGFANVCPGGRTPSLFLQELVHLMSLLNAVAFSTLRNDVEGCESPLDMYHPGTKLPKADPRKHKKEIENWTTLRYIFGFDRTPQSRTQYNASRPLPVLGGISDSEIKFLQRAKGPGAKVALAHFWIAEFIIREDRAGTLGKIGPPIISRVMQFLSDGMIYYSHCRKIMFIPFPFPHAQLSAFFNATMIGAVPLLMHEYANNLILASVLTFMTVTCLCGLHEVARELENPFRNVPNEIPLYTLQAMFNESLITVYSGYHPDHFWNGDEYRYNANLYGTPLKYSEGTPSSRRIKTPPASPRNNRSSNKNLLPPLSADSAKSITGESEDIAELRRMVMEQSSEIKRLHEIFKSSPTASSEATRSVGSNREVYDAPTGSFNTASSLGSFNESDAVSTSVPEYRVPSLERYDESEPGLNVNESEPVLASPKYSAMDGYLDTRSFAECSLSPSKEVI